MANGLLFVSFLSLSVFFEGQQYDFYDWGNKYLFLWESPGNIIDENNADSELHVASHALRDGSLRNIFFVGDQSFLIKS